MVFTNKSKKRSTSSFMPIGVGRFGGDHPAKALDGRAGARDVT